MIFMQMKDVKKTGAHDFAREAGSDIQADLRHQQNCEHMLFVREVEYRIQAVRRRQQNCKHMESVRETENEI